MVLVLPRSSHTHLGPHGNFLLQLLLLNCLYFFLSLAIYSLKIFLRRTTLSFLFNKLFTQYESWKFPRDSCWSNALSLYIVTQMMPTVSLGRFFRLVLCLWEIPILFLEFSSFRYHCTLQIYLTFFHYCPWFLLVEHLEMKTWVEMCWQRPMYSCPQPSSVDRGMHTEGPAHVHIAAFASASALCTHGNHHRFIPVPPVLIPFLSVVLFQVALMPFSVLTQIAAAFFQMTSKFLSLFWSLAAVAWQIKLFWARRVERLQSLRCLC